MCLVVVVGEMVRIWVMMGWILGRERARSRIVEGKPEARQSAVAAPILPSLGPVMRNVRSLTREGKSEAMVEPSVVKLYLDMVVCERRVEGIGR